MKSLLKLIFHEFFTNVGWINYAVVTVVRHCLSRKRLNQRRDTMTGAIRITQNTNDCDQNARQLRSDFLASMFNALGKKIREAFTPFGPSRC